MLTLILLLQISPPSLTLSDTDLEVEWPEILNTAIESQLRQGGVRVVKGDEMISLQTGERVLGVPRLVSSVDESPLMDAGPSRVNQQPAPTSSARRPIRCDAPCAYPQRCQFIHAK